MDSDNKRSLFTPSMYRLRLFWTTWLMLELLVLHAAAAAGPAVPASARAIDPTPAWAQVSPDQSHVLCQESSSGSQELSRRSEWQSKKGRVLTRCLSAVLQERSPARRPQRKDAAAVPPSRRVLYRKLPSPSPTDDDPLVS